MTGYPSGYASPADLFGVSTMGNTLGTTGVSAFGQVIFVGGDNITLSQSILGGSATITISGGAGGGGGGIAASAGTQSVSTGTVKWADSNGISFGMSLSSQITASYTVPSTAGLISFINVSAGTTSNDLTHFVFSNSNGLAFGLNGSTITGSYTVPVVTAGSDTFGMSNLGNTSGTTGVVSGDSIRFILAGGNNITLSQSLDAGNRSGTITISAFNQTNQSAIRAFGATNTGNTAGNTGVSTGIDWVLAGTNNVTISESTVGGGPNTIWISAAGGGAGAFSAGVSNLGQTAGSTGVTGTRLVFVGTNGLTLSQSTDANGATITITPSMIDVIYPVSGGSAGAQLGQSSLALEPFHVGGFVTASVVHVAGSVSAATAAGSSQSGNLSFNFGIYTRTGSTLSLYTSGSTALSWSITGSTSSVSHHGLRIFPIPLNMSLTPGAYWAGLLTFSGGTAGNAVLSASNLFVTQATATFSGVWGSTTALSRYWHLGAGTFSAQTAALPASVAFSQLTGNSSQGHRQFWFGLLNYSH